MNKDDKNSLLVLGGIALLGWLLSRKKKGKCPNCGYPVDEDNKVCPNCGQPLNWEAFILERNQVSIPLLLKLNQFF